MAPLVGWAVLAIPTVDRVARQDWTTQQGQYGVIALAIGVFLLARTWRATPSTRSAPNSVMAWSLVALGASVNVLGRLADETLIEAYALYATAVGLIWLIGGFDRLKTLALPLFYIFLSLPAPFVVTFALAAGLRILIAGGVVELCRVLGLTAARDGLSMFIDNHRIDMDQACSGMNSLISLTAISLAYLHLVRTRSFSFYLLIIPPIALLAVAANFARVFVVVILAHLFGEGASQGVLHESAGLIAFAVSLGGVMLLDAMITERRAATV